LLVHAVPCDAPSEELRRAPRRAGIVRLEVLPPPLVRDLLKERQPRERSRAAGQRKAAARAFARGEFQEERDADGRFRAFGELRRDTAVGFDPSRKGAARPLQKGEPIGKAVDVVERAAVSRQRMPFEQHAARERRVEEVPCVLRNSRWAGVRIRPAPTALILRLFLDEHRRKQPIELRRTERDRGHLAGAILEVRRRRLTRVA
jgi:hypothetical protein